MGTLRHADDEDKRYRLPPRCLIGRTLLARVRLEKRCASHEHAAMEWAGGHWRVRDLGSRNGTAVNGCACNSGWCELVAGDRLSFGGDSEVWILVDASPPPPAAIGTDGALRMGAGELLTLPDEDEPTVSIQRAEEGWILDDGGRFKAVETGTLIDVAGESFELLLPEPSSLLSTLTNRPALHVDELAIKFEFDRTEEHVRMTLESRTSTVALPERSFAYLLMLLARTRLHDRTVRGLPEDEAGWIDSADFARQLKARPEKVNVDICRARKLFAEHHVVDAARVVERRPQTQQLRLGIGAIELVPLWPTGAAQEPG